MGCDAVYLGRQDTNVSEKLAASVFRVKMNTSYEVYNVLRNVDTYQPDYTESHPIRP
jgi:hypothetical protein